MTEDRQTSHVSGDVQNSATLLYRINNSIIERNLLQPDQRILIAVSGGQDSICLLIILFHLKKKWNWKLGIIHCDHRWDSSSKLQAEHVASLAVNLQINYHEGISIESVQKEGIARIWRYKTIQIVAISNNYTAIITGHSASDRIETLLYNLTRGSGLHGLQSIKWKRYLCFFRFTHSVLFRTKSSFFLQKKKYRKTFDDAKARDPVESLEKDRFYELPTQLHLIRPLLETTRTEIRNGLKVWNCPSWPDVSNKELRIRRNRIRHRLIPYIRIHYNPNIDQTLARWAEIVQSETLYLEQLTNYILLKFEMKKKIPSISSPNAVRGDPIKGPLGEPCKEIFYFYQSAIPIHLLRSLPLAIQRRVLKQYIYRNTNRILGFQDVEHIRLSCLFSLRDYFPSPPCPPFARPYGSFVEPNFPRSPDGPVARRSRRQSPFRGSPPVGIAGRSNETRGLTKLIPWLRNWNRPANFSNHISIRSMNSTISSHYNDDRTTSLRWMHEGRDPLTTGPSRRRRLKGTDGRNNQLSINNPWLIFSGGIKLLITKNYIFLFSPQGLPPNGSNQIIER